MDSFEELLASESLAVERYVKFRISSHADAEDVLQEVFITAFRKFSQLKSKDAFKPWIISIAKNKCSDYFRSKSVSPEIPAIETDLDSVPCGRGGDPVVNSVRETLNVLGDNDRKILDYYFLKELSQSEIAERLDIPIGTVKSRLHNAKNHFKAKYPYPYPHIPKKVNETKGIHTMKKLPEILPEYEIIQSDEKPFSAKWEEIMGWFLVPKTGEKLSWGMYDLPSRKCDTFYDMQVTGKARINGNDGVQIEAKGNDVSGNSKAGDYTFIAQLTEKQCRLLAASYEEDDANIYYTYDDEDFLTNWGYGYNNYGNNTDISAKGDIKRNGNIIESVDKEWLIDIVGRYTVKICGKEYDTVCVIDLETYNPGVVTEQFLDKNGRTILWRRFNRDDWAIDLYKKKWSVLLPENERFIVNGKTYVHWYDCITDYIL